MAAPDDDTGCDRLEDAARGDIPAALATMIGSHVEGDHAVVWLLTNDRPPYEAYESYCVRREGRWHFDGGSGGFGTDTPEHVLARARELGWS
jgi:hypothetical protein